MYKLLIVDDEEDIRRGIARGIPWQEWGFEIVGQAENGEEAVRLIEEKRPDVVLSDIRMPKMDGIELMQYIHNNNPDIKIIILSGYNDVEYLNMAIRNQVTEYLLKPTDIDEFEALFHRLKAGLDEERRKRRELEILKSRAIENQDLFYGRVLSNLLEGYVGGEEEYGWKQEIEDAGIDFNRCVVTAFNSEAGENEQGEEHFRLKQKMIQYCNSREMPWKKHFFLHRDGNVVGVITLNNKEYEGWLGEQKKEKELNELLQVVEEIQGEIGDTFGFVMKKTISRVCRSEKELPSIYKKIAEELLITSRELGSQNKTNTLVASIQVYLEKEYCSNLVSLESTAEHFRKSPAYISRIFKQETGFNFSDYITRKRMEKSKILLKDLSLKVYEIAEMTGYADASNFIKVFRKNCGMSPNEYRSLF
jgi:two-component system response regulator YesN